MTLDKRKDAFESKYAHDEEMKFKVNARRNRLLGNWAAEKLGYEGQRAADYAMEVVKADFQEAGDDDVLRKVKADFEAAGVPQSEHQIRRTMDELLITAAEQLARQ